MTRRAGGWGWLMPLSIRWWLMVACMVVNLVLLLSAVARAQDQQPGEVLQRWKDRNHTAHPEWNLEPFFEAKPEDSGLWRPVASRLAEDQSGLPANERRSWVMAPWAGCTDLRLRVTRTSVIPSSTMEPDQVVVDVSPFDSSTPTYRVGTCIGVPVTPVPEPNALIPGAMLLAAMAARRRCFSRGDGPRARLRPFF